MNKTAKIWEFIKEQWPLELSGSLVLLVAVSLLGYKLNSLIPGASFDEYTTLNITGSLPSLAENFVNYPYYFAVYLVRFLISDGIFAARLVSVMSGLLAAFSISVIVHRWFNPRIAIVAATVFIAHSWFLVMARSGSPAILPITVVTSLFASSLWLFNSPKKLFPAIALSLTLLASMFTPLAPLLFIVGLIVILIVDRNMLKSLPRWVYYGLGGVGFISALTIGLGIWLNPGALADVYGIQGRIIGPSEFYANFNQVFGALFWRSPVRPDRWLSDLPLFDIFGTVFAVLGIYHHERLFGSRRSLLLFSGSAVILIATILGEGVDTPGFSLAYPLITLFIVSGLFELLELWKRVFPLNPIAKNISAAAFAVLIGASSYYQLSRFLVAWPRSTETRSSYSANINTNQDIQGEDL